MKNKIVPIVVLSFLVMAVGVSAAPTIDGGTFSPEDGSTGVSVTPTLSAEVNSTGETTISFWRNNDGTWTKWGEDTTTDGDNYKAELEISDLDYETEYTWTVNVSDTSGWVNSSEMTFTTQTAADHSVDVVAGLIPLIIGMTFISMLLVSLSKFMKF
jgi:hypothetical protein